MHTRNDSTFVRHVPCRKCGSSNNAGLYTDGHEWCFGCSHYVPGEGGAAASTRTRRPNVEGLLQNVTPNPLDSRKITAETCEKMGYGTTQFRNQGAQVATYYNKDGHPVAQKVRLAGKKFSILGSLDDALPFGAQAWPPTGKRIIVTEGEIDALSMSQVQGNRYPVVSITCGADRPFDDNGNPMPMSKIKKYFAKHRDYFLGFDEVVLMFDSDDPGVYSARAAAEVIGPKARIASLPLKDANEMLVKGMVKELLDAPWRAKKHQPDGVVEGSTLKDKALTGITQGLPWCWPTLNEYTHGRVAAEVIMLGAGTGVGKTDFLTQQVDYDRRVLKIKPGVIFLEQNPEETMLRLIGKAKGKLYHVPQDFPEGEIAQAWEEVEAESAPIFLYDSFGATTWADVENRIRYMVLGEGCQVIYLDHLTALAAAEDDERTGLERIMSQMAPLAKELGVPFIVVSHLSTPEGKPHEEGGRVMIRHFKGSRAIGFWSWTMIGLERDQQAEDPAERLTTTVRMLKIRRDGRHTGKVMQTRFNENTGRLEELEAPMLDHSDTSFDTDKAPALAGALDF